VNITKLKELQMERGIEKENNKLTPLLDFHDPTVKETKNKNFILQKSRKGKPRQ
jgi:hypothetical protein